MLTHNQLMKTDFKFSCPVCQQHLSCEEASRGTQIQCHACHAPISIPALLGLTAHAPSTQHAVGNYSPAVPPGQTPKIRISRPPE